MASTSTLILYVESGYVEGDLGSNPYVTKTQVLDVELNTEDSIVIGAAEVSGVAVGTPQSDNSDVAGVAERIITSSGNLVVDDPSVVLGTAVGIKVATDGIAQVDDSQVTAVVQRTVHGIDATPQAQVSEITGVAERTVVDAETDTTVSESDVNGSAGRTVNGTGIEQAQESIVSGVAERTINSVEADLTAEEVGVIVVAGDAERKVITQVSAVVVDSNSEVEATVKRTVHGIDATPQAQVSEITGVAERTVVGSGVLVDDSSTIDANAERVLSASGVEQAQISLVSGVAERIIDDEDQLLSLIHI